MSVIEEAIYEVQHGNTEKGLALLHSSLEDATEEEKYTIAQVYYEWGLIDRAIELFSELLQKYPDDSELKLILAEIYIDTEEDERAIDLLNSIEENDVNYIHALLESADLYQSQGLFEVAEQKLYKAKQLLPNEAVIDFALGELFFSMGEYKKSIPYYEKASKVNTKYNEVDVNERLAEALAATGKWEEALGYFQTIAEDNTSPDFLFRYGFTAYRSERSDIAIQVWENLLELDPDYTSVYLLLAKAYEDESMLEKAYNIALEGIKVDELNKEIHYFAGRVANNLGETTEAVEHLREAIAIDPGYKEAVLGIIDIFKKEDALDQIRDLLEHLSELGELDPIFQWELAKVYYELEAYQLALNNYREAYTSFTSDAEFLKEYGYFLVEEGRKEEAIHVLNQYMQVEPSDDEVEEFLYRLSL
ncbi:tetratricopeptide repeat protein [Salirhabdus sp. Marseille-P4669]|uniref:tetratricopeptide repeat protein n=1 Tax=Salirhabdus sp. Marseille-P4669 TaxID=2042310 RepID=UPI000C7DD4D8|nr:tetratricopeptide repeat protein [Salirhabdus sp. Marseille-P4669]